MDPALLNYLQSQQSSPETAEPQQAAAPYNPFDLGIRRAIESARESLGMTEKQQDKALRRSLMAFGQTMSQEPVQKGFWNNFGAVARSLNPALTAYDATEEQAISQNNDLANQILRYRAAEEEKIAKREDRQWRRQHAENQLAEQQRYHDLLNEGQQWQRGHAENQLAEQKRYHDMQGKKSGHGAHSLRPEELNNMFNHIDKVIEELGPNAYRGRTQTVLDRFAPGGVRLNPAQSELETLERVLKGKLFRAWGYRAQAEFKELPRISPYNSPEVNKSVIKQLRQITNAMEGITETETPPPPPPPPDDEWVLMRDPVTREEREVLRSDLINKPDHGLEEVK